MYNFRDIEKKQQQKWQNQNLFKCDLNTKKEKYYMLEMLAYPSGNLHMGHVRNYSIGDVVARYKWMKGFEVLHPFGWDSFGLPAENAAIKRGANPKDWTKQNTSQMKGQLNMLGISYDWTKEISTCEPTYYKWNQWLFNKMFEKKLTYKSRAFVNWSESLQTVLANEQVENAFCMGQEGDIVRKELNQWFFKTTDYAEELLADLEKLRGHWPDKVLSMQKNWIGKSEGTEFELDVPGHDSIRVFTTKVDTIYGATYLSISTGHKFAKIVSESNSKIKEYIESLGDRDPDSKRGIFTGHYAINPLTTERIPIWIADYVIDYGTRAVIGVPAHDTRDYEFAQLHSINIKAVLEHEKLPHIVDGTLINSEEFNGLSSKDARKAITETLEKRGVGKFVVNYRLKDWLISRQRYWGTPIPVFYQGEEIKLEQNLPVILPEDIEFKKGNPIETSPTFRKDKNRETDTMDTFVDSAWYYLRYLAPKDSEKIFDTDIANKWLQVDLYVGGVEHAVMHLLYSRFIHKVLRDLGLVNSDEPFKKLLTQGMVLSNSYYSKKDKKYYTEEEASKLPKEDLVVTMEKMSKSKNNGVSPEDMVEEYGVDSVRIFILFAAPPEKDLEWIERGIAGAKRFLTRVWNIVNESEITLGYNKDSLSEEDRDLLYKVNETINRVTKVMETNLNFNVAIAAIMELTNSCYEYREKVSKEVLSKALINIIKLLSPFAPHLCDEIWQNKKLGEFLIKEEWPLVDEELLKRDIKEIPIQINGKLRGTISISSTESKEEILSRAKSLENIEKYISNGIKKEIYIEGRLISLVV